MQLSFNDQEEHPSSPDQAGGMFKTLGRAAALRLSFLSGWFRAVFFASAAVFAITSLALLAKWNERYLVEVPARGGSIVEGIIGRPRFINPVIAKSDADRDLAMLIYSGLLRATPSGAYTPDLADHFTISSDGLAYTFTLRDNLFWHDGETVTSDDVAFTIEKVRDPNLAIKSPKRAAWDGVDVATPDKKTIVFTLKQPYAPFLDNVTLGIIPKHIWQGVPDEEFDVAIWNVEPIGSGPYRVTHIERDTSKGIPRWYDLTAFRHFALGEPYLTNLRISFFGNNKDLTEAFADGSVDQMPTIEPSYAKELTMNGIALTSVTLPRIFAAFFNQNERPIFADPSVRKALLAAADKDRIVANVLLGHGRRVAGPFPENLDPNNVTPSTSDGATGNRVLAGRTILEAAGWTLNASGVYEKANKKKKTVELLSFSIAVPDIPELKRAVDLLKDDWTKLGADVSVKVFEQTTFATDVLTPRKFDVLFYGQIYNRTPDPYVYWHSSQRNAPGLNIAMYTNKKTDKLLEDTRKTTDDALRRKLLSEFTNELRNDVPAIFIYSPDFLYATSPRLKGITLGLLTTESERFIDIANWFASSERVWKWFADRDER